MLILSLCLRRLCCSVALFAAASGVAVAPTTAVAYSFPTILVSTGAVVATATAAAAAADAGGCDEV